MASRSTAKKIGDREYVFTTLPAVRAIKLEVTIAKVIGEPLFKAFVNRNADEATAEQVGAAAIGLLTSRLDEAELLSTMGSVFEFVGYVEGKKSVARICPNGDSAAIDEHFTGRNRELWAIFGEALRFNFADFFPESLSLSGLIQKLGKSSPSNPPTSTG